MNNLELKVPPPVLVISIALAMWVATRWLPAGEISVPLRFGLSGLWFLAGLAIAVAGVVAFRKANTTIDPRAPQKSSSLVENGIFKHSRNPMYLGMVLVVTAWAIYLANAVSFAFIPLFVLYMHRFQIVPEERWMQQKFGDEYQAYAARVRRWV